MKIYQIDIKTKFINLTFAIFSNYIHLIALNFKNNEERYHYTSC